MVGGGETSLAAQQAIPDDVDHRYGYMAGIITITVIAVLIAWLRMYTRLFISRNAWWDDWIMFASTPLTIITNGFLLNAFHLGIGRHIHYVPKQQIPECFKWLWAAEPTNLFALFTVRVSIALFFLRLIPKHHKTYRRIIWGTIWALVVSDIYVTINYFIQCRPIQKVWLPDTPGTCLSDALYAAAPWLYQGVSILSDIALVSIPLMMFRTLNLPRKTKIGVMILCGLGVFTCACAIVKTALLPALFDKHEHDKTWSLAQLCFWAPMEICIGMICGSAPCLKPLWHVVTGTSSTTPSSNSYLPSSYASATLSKPGNAPIVGSKAAKTAKYGGAGNERSKSEESILPGAGDIELGSVVGVGRSEGGSDDGVVGGSGGSSGGMGILRTTEVEFRSERMR